MVTGRGLYAMIPNPGVWCWKEFGHNCFFCFCKTGKYLQTLFSLCHVDAKLPKVFTSQSPPASSSVLLQMQTCERQGLFSGFCHNSHCIVWKIFFLCCFRFAWPKESKNSVQVKGMLSPCCLRWLPRCGCCRNWQPPRSMVNHYNIKDQWSMITMSKGQLMMVPIETS